MTRAGYNGSGITHRASNMQVLIVGAGKLATELLTSLRVDLPCQIVSWANRVPRKDKSIVVHAGSGRELKEAISYCHETHSTLMELATGSEIDAVSLNFPVVVCPNTNIVMLKFMSMLAKSGHLFSGYKITLTESHQAQKTSVPGTAVNMAHALGLKDGDVRSVRDSETQRVALKIPVEHLDRHAFHQVLIEDAVCSVTMETRVYGVSPYADGVARIISAIRSNKLENRCYALNEFVENGWI
jgi:4-hydroxy-tetrahydrodipicolinate reductase